MNHMIQEHQISAEILCSLTEKLKSITKTFEPSQVYDSIANEKTIRPELRNSSFRTIQDKILFELCQKVVTDINEKNIQNKFKFMLFENDIMHIRYSEGEYFKDHEDYLSLTSNIIEEYTMIICIDAACDGGETILHLNEYFSHSSKTSITPGHCLVFRKDIPHEGSTIRLGFKEIITLNLWKVLDESDRIVVVKFNDSNEKCIIPINKIIANPTNSLLKIFLNTNIGSNKNSNVIVFNANCAPEDFRIIEKIYNGCAISYTELYAYRELIEYYLFDYQMLLIKNFAENIPPSPPIRTCIVSDNQQIMLFSDEGPYREFVEQIKDNNLPYVPFKLLLGEGVLTYGGEMSGTKPTYIKMTPFLTTFSEYNHIMFYFAPLDTRIDMHVSYYSDDSFTSQIDGGYSELFEKIKVGEPISMCIDDLDDGDILMNYEYIYTPSFTGNSHCFNLGVSMPGKNSSEWINKIFTPQQYKLILNKTSASVTRPSGDTSVYHIDKKNRINLESYHYEKIVQTVASSKLYEYAISQLNNMHFTNSQKLTHMQEHFFCNEEVYGNFSLLMVYGAIRID